MIGRFPNVVLFKFPRMSSEDVVIWKKFLEKFGKDYTSFDYDFKVGSGTDPGPEVPEAFRIDFIELSKKRIDAIGYSPDGVSIFEVKPRAGTQALGQLLTYKKLYEKAYPERKIKEVAVVCNFISDEEILLYNSFNISHYIISI